MLGLILWIVGVLLSMAVVFGVGAPMTLILAIVFLVIASAQIIEHLIS